MQKRVRGAGAAGGPGGGGGGGRSPARASALAGALNPAMLGGPGVTPAMALMAQARRSSTLPCP